MKNLYKYRTIAIGAGWSCLFAFIGVATAISVHCLSSHDECKRESLSGLWGDAVIGLIVMLTATTLEVRDHPLHLNKDSQTSEKPELEGDS